MYFVCVGQSHISKRPAHRQSQTACGPWEMFRPPDHRRESVVGRLAGYDDVNGAERLC
jgi:hypothetical protein